MTTYSDTLNTRKSDALNFINRLKSRIAEKQKEIDSLNLDIDSLKTNLNKILQDDFDCFSWWNLMDSIVKKEKGWKDSLDYLAKKFLPEGAKEIFCENVEEGYFGGELRFTFFYKTRYFEFNFLAPGKRFFDVEHDFGYHKAEVYEKGGSPYLKYHKQKEKTFWSFDIDEIKNFPEKYLQENCKENT